MEAEAKSYLTLNLLKPLSGQCGASQNQQEKFMRAYLDLGNLPIKQNKAVEQQSGGPWGGRPKAEVYITVVSLMGDLVRRV